LPRGDAIGVDFGSHHVKIATQVKNTAELDLVKDDKGEKRFVAYV